MERILYELLGSSLSSVLWGSARFVGLYFSNYSEVLFWELYFFFEISLHDILIIFRNWRIYNDPLVL